MSVPIASPVISDRAKEAVDEVLDSGMLAAGAEVEAFEAAFADFVGCDAAIGASSGTTALHAMFEAAGVGEGDVVLTSPFSFIASANAVVHAGARPVFADIDPETYNLDPEATRRVVEERGDVTALMPVHLYGLPADMDAFRDLAADHDLLLFEDAAQAHGGTYDGRQVGTLADAAAFSFYPTKNMTTGEGGMVTTDDPEIERRARQLVNHGRSGTYEHELVGYNYRLTNVAAAIGRDQLSRLPDWVKTRRANASALTDGLADVDGVETPTVPDGRTHAFHQYTIRTPHREALQAGLAERDVGYGVYYPLPIPDQPAYDRDVDVPEARRASREVLSLPVHPQLDGDDVETVVSAVTDSLEDTR